jgi:hypothetical protein
MSAKHSRFALFVALPVLLGFSGCLEHSVKTTVSADGSCTRVITVTADSGRAPDTKLPLPNDGSWTVRWRMPDSAQQKKGFTWVASKSYPSLASLAGDTAVLAQPGKIRISIQAGTSFRWFYTYFHYRETYRQFASMHRVSPATVLTDADIRRFTAGEGGDTLKSKVELWKNRNVADFFVSTLDTLVQREPFPAIPLAILQAHRADIIAQLLEKNDIEESLAAYAPSGAKKGLIHDSTYGLSGQGLEALRSLSVHSLGTELARNLPLEQAWLNTSAYLLDAIRNDPEGDFENTITLPGLLLDTNAGKVQGNTAGWSFKPDQIELMDFSMYAESRVVNTWAFIVTGAIVLGSILVIAFPSLRRTRK